MRILRATKSDVIRQLKSYSAKLNTGQVGKTVYERISGVYKTLRDKTTDDARCLEVDESEIENILTEYLRPIIIKNNMVACVYFGHQTSVYAKQKIETTLKGAAAVYALPTTLSTDKIIIYISYLNAACGEIYDIDFAANLLKYYDE